MKTTLKKQVLLFITTLIVGVSCFVGFIFYYLVQDSQQEVVINLLKEKNSSIQKNIEDFTFEKFQDISTAGATLEKLFSYNNNNLTSVVFRALQSKNQINYEIFIESKVPEIAKLIQKYSTPQAELKDLIDPEETTPYFRILPSGDSKNEISKYVILKNIYLNKNYHSTLCYQLSQESFSKSLGTFDQKVAGYFKPATTVATTDGLTIFRSQDANHTNYNLQKDFYIEKGQFIHVSDNIVTVVTSTTHDDFIYKNFPRWIVFSQFEKAQINEPFSLVYYVLIPSILLGLFLLIFSLNLYITYLFKPLQSVNEAFKRLAEGNFERIDIAYEKNDEFGNLVKGYNHMMVQLRTSLAELNSSGKFAALGEMAAGIAHEVNNPLQIIRGYATLIPKYLETHQTEKILDNSQRIIHAIDRIAKIVKSLRTYARDGSHDPFRPANVFQICDDTLVFCNEKFKNNNIDFKLTLPSRELEIACRPEQISQVLLNLLNNAADAISILDEKWIRLEVINNDSIIEFQVTNSGPKICDKIADRLFTPFFTTKEVGKGTGLGLSLSKGLAETHKGELLLDRSSPYTCFVLKLPTNLQN